MNPALVPETPCPTRVASAGTIRAQRGAAPVVCQLVWDLGIGGAEVLVRRFASELGRDFHLVFACLEGGGPLADELLRDGHCVQVIGRRPGVDLACARRLARFCRARQVDLVHAHQIGPFHYAGLARGLTGGWPILVTEHGRPHPDARSARRALLNRLLLRRHDRVVAVGQGVRQALIAYEAIPAQRIEVICNGRDLSGYEANPALRRSVRAELGIRDDQAVLIQVARLEAVKDHRTALEAVARLAAELPHVLLLVVGQGSEQAAIEALVDQLGLQRHVRLLGARTDVARLLCAADIGLLTSRSEGIPLTLIEAMAAALPCVATRIAGMDEVVVDGQTGLLAAAGDARGLADCLARLITDSAARRGMGAAGRQRAEQLFDERRMHEAYRQLYRQMLATTPSRRWRG